MNIPGYQLETELGRGGMATVYKAVQQSLHRNVALKVMATALAADANFGERFLREARTAASLNHPGILSIYDVGVDGHNYYIVMEYVPSGDLKQKLLQGVIAPAEALSLISQVAQALGHAHTKGFVHRDVKPENILFREDNTPVLADFGIAKAIGSGTKMTGTGMSIGTPNYMSPEQARGKQVNGRSDLYSLGIVLYEMLTGKAPFEAEDSFAVAYAHINDPVPRLPDHLSTLQPLLDNLLAKSPAERYPDASALLAAINIINQGQPIEIPEQTQPQLQTEVMVATKEPDKHDPLSSSGEQTVVRQISSQCDGYTDPVIGMEFVWFPKGCFQMGSSRGDRDETPIHQVCVDGFYMGKYAVTQAQYFQITGINPSHFKGNNCPVEMVNWKDTQDFINNLNFQTGKHYRLPTEAEWEYAAKGGANITAAGRINVDAVAWHFSNSGRKTHPVGQKQANGFGLYDMNGNVWEWCCDWYDSNYYHRSPRNNPQGPNSGSSRVLRGGSWNNPPEKVRLTDRRRYAPRDRINDLGFRLVLPSVQ